MNGLQGGDPKKLALALVIVSDSGELALRFLAGADVMDNVERNLATIQGQIDAHATCPPPSPSSERREHLSVNSKRRPGGLDPRTPIQHSCLEIAPERPSRMRRVGDLTATSGQEIAADPQSGRAIHDKTRRALQAQEIHRSRVQVPSALPIP